ncbi:kinase-like domain-containing protein, partial [Mycena crocata]
DDVDLRWHGNVNLLPGSASGTIGQLFDIHKSEPNPDIFFKNVPEKWSHLRGECMCFELYIDVVQAINSEAVIRNEMVAASSKPVSATKISLHIANVTINEDDGQVHVSWDTAETREAMLDNAYFACGKTKKVYRLSIGDQDYAAKRFFEVGNGIECVSTIENATQLENEMIRLKQGQWFLDKLYARADETETEVYKDFSFSDGLLVQEIIGPDGPSPASGLTMDSFMASLDTNPNCAIFWLLEPLRSSSVERWSGTLQHPPHENKPGRTMDTFMHFSYVYSQQTLVFADLQSESMLLHTRSRTGESNWILFDVMTHTCDGASGVGDHGEDGMQAILSDHVCDNMCKSLDMGEEHTLGRKAAAPTRRTSTRRKVKSQK